MTRKVNQNLIDWPCYEIPIEPYHANIRIPLHAFNHLPTKVLEFSIAGSARKLSGKPRVFLIVNVRALVDQIKLTDDLLILVCISHLAPRK